MKEGLLPLTQDAIMIGKCSYHDFYGVLIDEDEKEKIARSLGPTNKVMFLRNHGVVCAGATVEEAWFLMEYTITACEMQVCVLSVTVVSWCSHRAQSSYLTHIVYAAHSYMSSHNTVLCHVMNY